MHPLRSTARSLGLASILALSFGAASCSRKTAECNQLSAVVNQAAGQFTRIGNLKQDSAEETKAMLGQAIKATTETAAKLAAIKLTVKELQDFSSRYQTMCKGFSDACTQMLSLIQGATNIEATATAGGKAIEAAVAAVTKECGSNPKAAAGCETVGKILASLPDDPKSPDDFTQRTAQLRAAKIKDANLKKAVDSMITALDNTATLMKDAGAAEQRLGALTKKIETTVALEDPIVDGLNAFCQGQRK